MGDEALGELEEVLRVIYGDVTREFTQTVYSMLIECGRLDDVIRIWKISQDPLRAKTRPAVQSDLLRILEIIAECGEGIMKNLK